MFLRFRKYFYKNYNMDIKKSNNKFFDFFIMNGSNKTYVKIFNRKSPFILTFNSKTHIEVKIGKLRGNNFKIKRKTIYNIFELENYDKAFIFDKKPFKVLSYKNESELEDISLYKEHRGISFYTSLNELIKRENNE